ncbi:CYTH domain-containing protein [Microbacterium sp. ET2]|uniref:CYTH domain-containing protein n=1 Tax=Microbacterium albipurpureum TaxID=3050384 RepID=UPI00259C995D|nr:CYTH domain-containing protein [Microbacterium sp. ET2 (Ac-2212)]WJL95367.1 CYTH domain-containing protein [Microbacterium sp. ET2 (Ac-2212)]
MRSDPRTTTEPGEPIRSLEIEIKLDVGPDTAAPDWRTVPEVAEVAGPELRELDARYYDTADFALGRAGYALRRRTGGPDAGWHLKGPRRGAGRVELGWPLEEGESLPATVRAEIRHLTTHPVHPIARVRNRRLAVQMKDAAGDVVAEFLDDHVETRDEATGTERSWREWEIELGPAAPEDAERFLGDLADLARNAGARPASSESKIGRALGR